MARSAEQRNALHARMCRARIAELRQALGVTADALQATVRDELRETEAELVELERERKVLASASATDGAAARDLAHETHREKAARAVQRVARGHTQRKLDAERLAASVVQAVACVRRARVMTQRTRAAFLAAAANERRATARLRRATSDFERVRAPLAMRSARTAAKRRRLLGSAEEMKADGVGADGGRTQCRPETLSSLVGTRSFTRELTSQAADNGEESALALAGATEVPLKEEDGSTSEAEQPAEAAKAPRAAEAEPVERAARGGGSEAPPGAAREFAATNVSSAAAPPPPSQAAATGGGTRLAVRSFSDGEPALFVLRVGEARWVCKRFSDFVALDSVLKSMLRYGGGAHAVPALPSRHRDRAAMNALRSAARLGAIGESAAEGGGNDRFLASRCAELHAYVGAVAELAQVQVALAALCGAVSGVQSAAAAASDGRQQWAAPLRRWFTQSTVAGLAETPLFLLRHAARLAPARRAPPAAGAAMAHAELLRGRAFAMACADAMERANRANAAAGHFFADADLSARGGGRRAAGAAAAQRDRTAAFASARARAQAARWAEGEGGARGGARAALRSRIEDAVRLLAAGQTRALANKHECAGCTRCSASFGGRSKKIAKVASAVGALGLRGGGRAAAHIKVGARIVGKATKSVMGGLRRCDESDAAAPGPPGGAHGEAEEAGAARDRRPHCCRICGGVFCAACAPKISLRRYAPGFAAVADAAGARALGAEGAGEAAAAADDVGAADGAGGAASPRSLWGRLRGRAAADGGAAAPPPSSPRAVGARAQRDAQRVALIAQISGARGEARICVECEQRIGARDALARRELAVEAESEEPAHWPRVAVALSAQVRAGRDDVVRALRASCAALRREDARRTGACRSAACARATSPPPRRRATHTPPHLLALPRRAQSAGWRSSPRCTARSAAAWA